MDPLRQYKREQARRAAIRVPLIRGAKAGEACLWIGRHIAEAFCELRKMERSAEHAVRSPSSYFAGTVAQAAEWTARSFKPLAKYAKPVVLAAKRVDAIRGRMTYGKDKTGTPSIDEIRKAVQELSARVTDLQRATFTACVPDARKK